MRGFLLDTNVISEITRPNRNPAVEDFLRRMAGGAISVVTVHELRFGLERLPAGRRRQSLTEVIERFLRLYDDHILPLGAREAWAAALLRAEAERAGHTLHLADALIAGTAQVHGLTIATRTIDDFRGLGLALINPWQG